MWEWATESKGDLRWWTEFWTLSAQHPPTWRAVGGRAERPNLSAFCLLQEVEMRYKVLLTSETDLREEMLRSSEEKIYDNRSFYISRLIIMVITIVKPDEEIRNECKNLLNQTVDIDWLKKFYHSFIKWDKRDGNYPKVNTHDKEIDMARITSPWNLVSIDVAFDWFDWVKEKVKEVNDKFREEYWDRYIWIVANTLYNPTNIMYRYYRSEEEYVKRFIGYNKFEKSIIRYINSCIKWFSFDFITDNLRAMFINWDITLASLIRIVKWNYVEIKEDFIFL